MRKYYCHTVPGRFTWNPVSFVLTKYGSAAAIPSPEFSTKFCHQTLVGYGRVSCPKNSDGTVSG